jgi:hypothetical protein
MASQLPRFGNPNQKAGALRKSTTPFDNVTSSRQARTRSALGDTGIR